MNQATTSSRNVFEDLGLRNAKNLQVKAELTRQVYNIIKQLNLTQSEAAKVTGLKQPDISRLMRGRFSGFSTDRLLDLLNALDRDVDIIVKLKPRSRELARVRIKTA